MAVLLYLFRFDLRNEQSVDAAAIFTGLRFNQLHGTRTGRTYTAKGKGKGKGKAIAQSPPVWKPAFENFGSKLYYTHNYRQSMVSKTSQHTSVIILLNQKWSEIFRSCLICRLIFFPQEEVVGQLQGRGWQRQRQKQRKR